MMHIPLCFMAFAIYGKCHISMKLNVLVKPASAE